MRLANRCEAKSTGGSFSLNFIGILILLCPGGRLSVNTACWQLFNLTLWEGIGQEGEIRNWELGSGNWELENWRSYYFFAKIKTVFMKEAELANQIKELKDRVEKTRSLINLDKSKIEIKQLESQMSAPDFWADQDRAKTVSQRLAALGAEIKKWDDLTAAIEELGEIVGLDQKDQEVSLRVETEERLAALEKEFVDMEFLVLFDGKYDTANAVVAIHARAGGVDAQDWVEILLRMLMRFCENKGFAVKVLSESRGAEAGIKSIFFEVIGRYAYGYLKSENGVHRLVRISPFDAEKMRHTSFALVEIIPELEEVGDIEIKDEDLRIDVYRAGGHGGQSVNTTDSAVRIVHLPTGITVTCQNERSQRQNKETAMKVLKSKLHQYYQTEIEEERQVLRGEFTEAAWGNQARSYVIHPYKMVKDHRTGYETSDTDSVLNGDLQPFVESYLKHLKNGV
jgi:peptide chain release factor 2